MTYRARPIRARMKCSTIGRSCRSLHREVAATVGVAASAILATGCRVPEVVGRPNPTPRPHKMRPANNSRKSMAKKRQARPTLMSAHAVNRHRFRPIRDEIKEENSDPQTMNIDRRDTERAKNKHYRFYCTLTCWARPFFNTYGLFNRFP